MPSSPLPPAPKARPNPANRALRRALCQSSPEQVRRALAAGADPGARDWSGATALHHARDRASARLLLEAGARVDARDTAGATPLESALAHRRRAVAWCLHAVPGAVDPDPAHRDRLLRHAAAAAARPVVAALLAAGARAGAVDRAGRAPLHRLLAGPCALTPDGLEVARLLTVAGASWSQADARGRTPGSLALRPPVWPAPLRRFHQVLSRLGWERPCLRRHRRLLALAATPAIRG